MTKDRDETVIITHRKFWDERKKRREDRPPRPDLINSDDFARVKRSPLVGQDVRCQESVEGRLKVLAGIEALLAFAYSEARKQSPEQYARLLQVLTLPLNCAGIPTDISRSKSPEGCFSQVTSSFTGLAANLLRKTRNRWGLVSSGTSFSSI
jgi:hypothetical protein